MRSSTAATLGTCSSRFGPIRPDAPAAASVWQAPQLTAIVLARTTTARCAIVGAAAAERLTAGATTGCPATGRSPAAAPTSRVS